MTLPLRDFSPGDRPEPTPVPSPAGRRPGGVRALALATASFLAAGLLGVVVVGGGTAEAGTVGAGSYTETRPPGTALPKGCGDISTNPRQFVTANAPAGRDPHQRLVVVAALEAHQLRLQREPLRPTRWRTTPSNNGLGLSYTTTPAISGTATGVGEYHYPYTEDIRVGVGRARTPRSSRSTAGPTGRSPRTGTTARAPCAATIGHGLPFSLLPRSPAATRRSPPPRRSTVWANSGADGRLHRQRPRLRRVRADRRELDASPARASPRRWPARATSPSRCCRRPRDADRAPALAGEYGRYAHAHVTGTRVDLPLRPGDQHGDHHLRVHHHRPGGHRDAAPWCALYPHQWRASPAAPRSPRRTSRRAAPMKVLTGVSSLHHHA